MRIKRILTTLLVALMMFSLVAFASAAEENSSFDIVAEASSSAILSEGVFCNTENGIEIEVPLKVTSNPGVALVSLRVLYDSDKMTFVSNTEGSFFNASNGDTINVSLVDGVDENGYKKLQLLFYTKNWGSEDVEGIGADLVTLKFKLNGTFDGDVGDALKFEALEAFISDPNADPLPCNITPQCSFKAHHYAVIENGVQEATCTDPGTTTYKCTVSECNDVHVVTTATPLGHSYADATCTEPQTCIRGCGSTIGEALGHSWQDATCTTPKTCSVCGETEGEALDHKWNPATCTTPKTCSVCGETEGEALGHKWQDATCTTPKTCSVCGETEGEVAGHEWNPATCTTPKTCSVCGETEGDALGHTWTEANCTTPKTCSVCGATDGEPLGHTPEVIPEKKPTCTEPGATAGTKCSVCGVVIVAPQQTLPTGHGVEIIDKIDPTCTEVGYEAGVKCPVCGVVTKAPVEIPALGHTEEILPAVAPDCENTGLTEGKRCTRCGVDTVPQEVIPANGHELSAEYKAPTCTEPGYGTKGHCTVCNTILSDKEYHPTGHNKGFSLQTGMYYDIDPVVKTENNIAPTCTEGGSYETVTYCATCDVEISRVKTDVDKLGHDIVIDEAVAPTCTETGLTQGQHCSRCNDMTIAQVEVPALGHSFLDSAYVSDGNATCLADGTETAKCERCDATDTRIDEGSKLPHSFTDYKSNGDATCTEDGTKTAKCDSVGCDATDTQPDVGSALGHTEVIDEAVEPTCTETGLTEGKHCSVCNVVLVAQQVVPEKGHTPVGDAYVAPTCTEPGKSEGDHCSVCDEPLHPQEEIPALGHLWVDADCLTPKTCSRCKVTEGEALGHDEVNHDAKAPTCTEIGWDAYVTCSRCDYTTYVEKAALGHDEVNHDAKAPTCTEIGWDAYVTCSRCDYTTYVEKAALGHDEVNHDAKAPTCTEIGWDAYVTCSRCDYTTYVEKAALGHTEVVDAAVDPTCTETGLTEGKHCSVCEVVLIAQEEVAALGHTEVVDAAVAPTTSATGLTEGKHCSVCNTVLVPQNVIKKLPVVVTAPVESWEKGDGDMVFKSDADFADFEAVTVNGEVLAPENYTVTEGSIVVTLSEKYLKSLENGTYTICIKSANGTAESTFTIENSSGWIVAVIIIAAVVVCAGIVVGVVFYKKKKAAN